MTNEYWRDIPGYEGRYLVSDQGQVRSLLTNKILRAAVEATGYVSVCLKDARGGQRTHLIHLLVLRAFVGPRPADQETRHLNGIRTDNRLVENLRYGTRVENRADRARCMAMTARARTIQMSNYQRMRLPRSDAISWSAGINAGLTRGWLSNMA